MRALLERLVSIGNPDFRAVAATTWVRQIRDFTGELAMKGAAQGEPEAEIISDNPAVGRALKVAVDALGKLGRAILDTERSIDISPRVRGRLAAEAAEGTHLNKYDPGSLLGAVVTLLEREGLEDAAAAVRDVSRQVSRAWQGRER